MFSVAIIMGSDSDLKVMSAAAAVLEQFAVPFEMKVLSAHRTPDAALAYAAAAEKRGCKVIIAGAGAAAHLPGVLAAVTALPVIGVPIDATSFSGLDSLLSIVQMPGGIPVATVGVNNAKNAGLLAVRILALGSAVLRTKLKAHRAGMKKEVLAKDARLCRVGYKKYLEEKKA